MIIYSAMMTLLYYNEHFKKEYACSICHSFYKAEDAWAWIHDTETRQKEAHALEFEDMDGLGVPDYYSFIPSNQYVLDNLLT